VYTLPHALDDLDVIQMYDHEGYDVGYFAWRTCDECRRGYIVKISITPEFQRKGYGRRLIQRALRDGPDYAWSTTGQSPDARRFFPVMSAETGAVFNVETRSCTHVKPAAFDPSSPRKPRAQARLVRDV